MPLKLTTAGKTGSPACVAEKSSTSRTGTDREQRDERPRRRLRERQRRGHHEIMATVQKKARPFIN
jgi:hypothetical protein